jgi:hypothetical protein
MKMRVCVNFKRCYSEEYKHVINQDNSSEYICRLVRRDRLKKDDDLETNIKELLNRISGSNVIEVKRVDNDRKKAAVSQLLNMGGMDDR